MDVLGELLPLALVVAVVLALGRAIARIGLSRTNALGALVEGWRPDPWPRGVQEDDEFRWHWRPPEGPGELPPPAMQGVRPAVALRRRP